MSGIEWLSATQLLSAYRTGALSPAAVVEHLLDRISRFDARLNVFVHLDAEGARRQAERAEAAIRRGERRPLQGVPVGIKDIIEVAGLPTTCHSQMMSGAAAATRDAAAVSRLRDSGAIILGKLATHEFAIGGPAFDLPFPPARNPWNPDHHPGGSSSGSAAGLSAGFFPLAVGTDTGGSVRHPASACGIVGLKPTYDLVPRQGVFPLSWTLDTVGPMARRVDDVLLLLDVLVGREPSAAAVKDIAGLRIGFVRRFHERDLTAGTDTAAALETAADVLSGLGAVVTEVDLPPLQDFTIVSRTILTAEAWSIHGDWIRSHPERYGKLSRRRLMVGAFITAETYLWAKAMAARLRQAVDEAFAHVDVLLTASSMNAACRMDDEQEIVANYLQHARAPFNVTGHPALAMMCGLSQQGLPIALQFVGPHRCDDVVLRAAAAYETATNWTALRPPAFAEGARRP